MLKRRCDFIITYDEKLKKKNTRTHVASEKADVCPKQIARAFSNDHLSIRSSYVHF